MFFLFLFGWVVFVCCVSFADRTSAVPCGVRWCAVLCWCGAARYGYKIPIAGELLTIENKHTSDVMGGRVSIEQALNDMVRGVASPCAVLCCAVLCSLTRATHRPPSSRR
jgi:hypothetical protein